MVIDNIKRLFTGICIVLLLLCLCMTIDYADDNISTKINQTVPKANDSTVIVSNNNAIIDLNNTHSVIVGKSGDTVHIIKPKVPTIGMYAKPSCGCRYSYTWHYREFVNYCPNCHHYGTLRKNPKGVPEREYTCCRCSSDFCGCCGKEKYSWSRVYLRKC